MAVTTPTEQEIRNIVNPEENSVVIVDSTTPTFKAVVDSSGALKVTGGGGGFEILDGATVSAGTDLGGILAGKDTAGGTYQFLSVDANGRLQIDVFSSALPTGAATETTLSSLLTELQLKADLTETQPVSVASLPLPTGASTATLQLPDGHNVTVDNLLSNPVPAQITDGTLTVAISGDRLKVDSTQTPGATENVVITDGTTGDEANVDVSGRLQVSTGAPLPPPTGVPVVEVTDGNLGNNAVDNQFFTITSGKSLTIQRFEVAGQGGANNGWFFELYEDPTGVGNATTDPVDVSWILISLIVIQENGDSKFVDIINTPFVGDSTRRIVSRRKRLGGGGAKRAFIKFSGFEV